MVIAAAGIATMANGGVTSDRPAGMTRPWPQVLKGCAAGKPSEAADG